MSRTKEEKKGGETIKVGNTTVKIYTFHRGTRTIYSLNNYVDGKRKVQQFADLAEARRVARSIASRLEDGERRVLSLTDNEAWAYERAVVYLKPLGVKVDEACHEYAKARSELKSGSLLEAVKFYAIHHGNRPNKTVQEVIAELLEDRSNRSKKYTNDLKFRLNRFGGDVNLYIGDVTPQQISDWLKRLKLHPRSQRNFKAIITTLFRFAIDRGYLPEGRTAPEKVKVHLDDDGEIEIFSPGELQKILDVASMEALPYVFLGAFAGIRTAEICRLTWQNIDLSSGFIEMKAARTKTRARRLIPITDNLKAWIRYIGIATGPVVTLKRPDETMGRICKSQKPPLEWKRNGLRHSYASYRYALVQNENQVASELGNSPGMVHGHYRQLAKPEQADAWFSLLPPEET